MSEEGPRSQPLHLPDALSAHLGQQGFRGGVKDQVAYGCLPLDKDFSKWWDKRISKGLQQWDEHDKMTCDHTDPCKEAKCAKLLGSPLDYMMSHGVFEPK